MKNVGGSAEVVRCSLHNQRSDRESLRRRGGRWVSQWDVARVGQIDWTGGSIRHRRADRLSSVVVASASPRGHSFPTR